MVQVAAGVIRQNGKILICRRGAGGSCAFLWEFPGGKREPGETPRECLMRECREELEVEISVGDALAETTYRYPDITVSLTFFEAEITGGEPKPRVHTEIRWAAPERLARYAFCPADVDIVGRLSSGTLPDPTGTGEKEARTKGGPEA